MTIAASIARYLLGATFLIFGLNAFFHFIPQQPMPSGWALQFASVLMASHYMDFVALIQIGGGILLLLNSYVPLALTLLGPVIVNILLFHLLLAPAGLPLAILVAVLWALVAIPVRSAFARIFEKRAIQK